MNVIKLEEMGTILMHIALQYTHPDFESMYSDWSTVHDIGEKLVKMSDQPQLNPNQQMLSGSELIGVIYSQLLEDFGFEYIEKDLWMIAENLSEKIANDQPKLNPNQQIVLEWLKLQAPTAKPMQVIFWMMNNAAWGKLDELRKPIMHLTDKQQAQVLEEFGKWAQEQEEE